MQTLRERYFSQNSLNYEIRCNQCDEVMEKKYDVFQCPKCNQIKDLIKDNFSRFSSDDCNTNSSTHRPIKFTGNNLIAKAAEDHNRKLNSVPLNIKYKYVMNELLKLRNKHDAPQYKPAILDEVCSEFISLNSENRGQPKRGLLLFCHKVILARRNLYEPESNLLKFYEISKPYANTGRKLYTKLTIKLMKNESSNSKTTILVNRLLGDLGIEIKYRKAIHSFVNHFKKNRIRWYNTAHYKHCCSLIYFMIYYLEINQNMSIFSEITGINLNVIDKQMRHLLSIKNQYLDKLSSITRKLAGVISRVRVLPMSTKYIKIGR